MSSRRPAVSRRRVAPTGYARRAVAIPRSISYRAAPKPRRATVSGRGGYYVSGGAYARGKLGLIGGGLAVNAGYSHGSVNAPKLTGLGAYDLANIRHNVLIRPDIPQVVNTYYAEGGTVVRHREYLGPIVTSATAGSFTMATFPLNPAQGSTFPWLSTIAANYEEYKPNGLMFEFRSTASDAIASSTNLALGQVMMCTQYDPTDPDFSSDVELLNYTWAQSGKVSDTIQHFVECDPKQSPLSHLYTRDGGYSSSADLRFSDFGKFSIATSGLQGTSVQVGQLWVTYEFILYKPKMGAQQADAGGWYHFFNNVGVSDTNPLGSNPMDDGEFDGINNLAITLADDGSDGDIVFPPLFRPTSFQVTYASLGSHVSNVVGANFGDTVDPGIQFVEHFDSNQAAIIQSPPIASSADRNLSVTWITIVGDGKSHTLKVKNSYIPGSGVTRSCDLYICQIPYLDPQAY